MKKEKNEMQQEGLSELKVLKSAAGFYVGTELTEDGVTMPYSRESSYFRSENAAKEELKKRTAKDPTVESSLENKSNSTTKGRQITNQPLVESELENEQLTDEQYKSLLKEDMLSKLMTESKRETKDDLQDELKYKEQFRQQVLEQLNTEPSKTTESEEDREKRRIAMKRFEEKHSFDHVYKLKKEVLSELKSLDLSDKAREKLLQIEKALESEKEKHDKMQAKESGPKTRMEKRNQKKNKKFRSNDYER
ncbi:hypothetical protein ABC970_17750 [Bacillus licheniformis]|uniref:hypothetical protein n=1 Tax=Bacillus TaxID=1386 RepID=UPI000ADC8825|nr:MULTISPECIES: hypothetical protein [Bacillus]MCD2526255.1 hypothetical protein [Bacillus licheniformis]MDE1397169.1 hypothetical protein [Bacillus licheniformis]PAC96993.1 hypothetical protein CHH89_19885 [Bacillus licheniformis]PAE47511.1 hypothetical protein CHH94_09360 [Bacillus licheniformis]TWN77136.1 hypothetical protein CHCC20494_1199 [Bacillus licheniformis]